MGHHSKNISGSAKRKFVLADKIALKADHVVDQDESTAYGSGTPVTRKSGRVEQDAPQEDLQDSIKSILAKFE